MHDQADELRELVLRSTLEHAWASPIAPRRIVVSGGRPGVGTTTVAVNLAVAIAAQGNRTVLVDANLNSGGVSRLCSLHEHESIASVLAARRTIHEVLQNGPAGLQILPGVDPTDKSSLVSPAAQERLIQQLVGFGQYAEVMVLDAGCGLTHVVRRFWRMADCILLVATPEPGAITDAYSAIKVLPDHDAGARIRTVVNMFDDGALAEHVHQRLQDVSQRFLGRKIRAAGSIPLDRSVAEAAEVGQPFVMTTPHSPASAAIEALTSDILATAFTATAGV